MDKELKAKIQKWERHLLRAIPDPVWNLLLAEHRIEARILLIRCGAATPQEAPYLIESAMAILDGRFQDLQ